MGKQLKSNFWVFTVVLFSWITQCSEQSATSSAYSNSITQGRQPYFLVCPQPFLPFLLKTTCPPMTSSLPWPPWTSSPTFFVSIYTSNPAKFPDGKADTSLPPVSHTMPIFPRLPHIRMHPEAKLQTFLITHLCQWWTVMEFYGKWNFVQFWLLLISFSQLM